MNLIVRLPQWITPQISKLTAKQTITTLPETFKGENSYADIHVHPNGKFLYGSNRGHTSIVIFNSDQGYGHLNVGGDWPRYFVISSLENHLLVVNQRSNNIVVFKIDIITDKLQKKVTKSQSLIQSV
jgi:6-phosphogluconolactonase